MLKNKVNHEIRKAKIKKFNEKINSKIKDSKIFHNSLKQQNVVNSKQISNQSCLLDPNTLNKAFVSNNNESVDEESVSEEIERILVNSLPEMFAFHKVSEKQVLKAVNSIKTNACGVDKVSSYFIKLSIEYSVHAFTDIINAALKHNYFPVRWKQSLIKPLPKNQNQIVPTDFRPISLLPAFSKIMEKLMALQIKKYLEENNMLDDFQSAYKKHFSTTTALLDITDNIYKALDTSEIVVLVLLDYSKAFDCANHKLILAKLKAMGFGDAALELLLSYLSDRSQQVRTNTDKSTWLDIKNGVPQGSILGPLLFTILVSDLHNMIKHCKYHCYADDTQIYCRGKTHKIVEMVNEINSDLTNIAEYSRRNCLKLNTSKSNYIIIGSPQNITKLTNIDIPPITINGRDIERQRYIKNLGVIFDESLSWTKHINVSIASAFGKLKQVYRHRNFLAMDARINICESYILSKFNYCDIILQNMSLALKKKIQQVQNCCTRFIFGLRKYDHISICFKKLNTLTMDQRREVHGLTQIHKIEMKLAPKYLINRISHHKDMHTYNTRGKTQILITKANTTSKQNTFFYKSIKRYNELLNKNVFNKDTHIITVKKKCKKYFLEHNL